MKSAVFAILLLAFYQCAESLGLDRLKFEQFKNKYNKVYASQEEENERYAIFLANLRLIEEWNQQSTPVYGITKFFDLTQDEFQQRYLRRSAFPSDVKIEPATGLECGVKNRFPELCNGVQIDSLDWRSKGAVTGVKNQGQCGSCWSFGTTGDIEGSWFLSNHSLISLSEQQLVSCDTAEDDGCNGGMQEDAFDYIIKVGGIMSEKDYPYTSGDGIRGKCKVDKTKFVANISRWVQVAKGASDEAKMVDFTQKNGPITIGINAGPMQYYSGGVDHPRLCNKNNLDHAVLIVGFGTDSGTPYWLIKNSWGSDWGENGYYRIYRGSNVCGLAEDVVHAFV